MRKRLRTDSLSSGTKKIFDQCAGRLGRISAILPRFQNTVPEFSLGCVERM